MGDSIDRIAPTRRPTGRVAGYQKWRDLTFLHWQVDAAALRPLIPAELELDAFDGQLFVGVVPFTMRGVRPWWAPPMPGVSNFHETNVRTYVHRGGRDPGVWFFSLEAANRLAVWLARTFWHLPYHHARMTLARDDDGTRRYDSVRTRAGDRREHLRTGERFATRSTGGMGSAQPGGATCRVTATPLSEPAAAAPGTLEHFLGERYVLYASSPRGLRMGRVHHTPYPLQRARATRFDETLIAAAGLPQPTGEPLAHFASGVDVEVFSLERI